MKPSTALVKILRGLNIPVAQARTFRAAVVAQALAYQVPLEAGQTLEVCLKKCEPTLLQVLNEVNEFLPVDTGLTRSLFQRLLRARLELLTGVQDPALLRAALDSRTQQGLVNAEVQDVLVQFIHQPQFSTAQQQVADIMATAFQPAAEGESETP